MLHHFLDERRILGFLSLSLHSVWLFLLSIAPRIFMIFTEVNLLKKFKCRALYPPRAKRGHKRYMEHWGTFCSEFFTEPSRYFARGKTPHTKCIRGGFIDYTASFRRCTKNFRFLVTITSWCLAIFFIDRSQALHDFYRSKFALEKF